MAQLSRPYQIALGAIVLLAAVWFVALRGHSSSRGGSSAAPPPVSTPASKAATPSSAYHGSAPGVAGLTRDIEKARGAVSASEHSAQQLEEKSAQASASPPVTSAPSSGGAAVSGSPSSSSSSHLRATSQHRTVVSRHSAQKHGSSVHRVPSAGLGAPAMQLTVERELEQHKTVILLFWDPSGADDKAVRRELQAVQNRSTLVHVARASEVGSFGSFTQAAQVYATPAMLIIEPNGRTSTLTGLTDAYAIRQAITDAQHS